MTHQTESSATVGVEEMLTTGGLTYRQLEVWTTNGWLRTDHAHPGSGRRRHWPAGEMDVARAMTRLTRAGVQPAYAALAARDGGWLAPGVRVVDEDGRPICATPRPPEGGGAS